MGCTGPSEISAEPGKWIEREKHKSVSSKTDLGREPQSLAVKMKGGRCGGGNEYHEQNHTLQIQNAGSKQTELLLT
jgi:hypothetical protein